MFKKIKLMTELKMPKASREFILNETSKIAAVGSCFAENLVGKLLEYGVKGGQNPTGIVYNTDSMLKAIKLSCGRNFFTKDNLFSFNDKFHSWLHHGKFSNSSFEEALKIINETLKNFHDVLLKANFLILTPASSVVYVYNETGEIVANCHKVPNNEFLLKTLSAEQNYLNLKSIVETVLGLNAELKIIFTLSPVRHYPGNLVLNSRSKAHLLTAIHEVVDKNSAQCCYFPAYEIMNDQLRDYRFYKEDLVHPNELAERIIFQLFTEHFTSQSLQKLMQQNAKKIRQQQHIQK